MAELEGVTSNSLFEVLEEWESQLKAIEMDIPSSESRTPPAPRLRGPSL